MDLIATKALRYGTRRLVPGEAFQARNDRDGRLLIAVKKARQAEVASPDVPSDPEAELKALRALYEETVGKRPYHAWDTATLREKIDAAG